VSAIIFWLKKGAEIYQNRQGPVIYYRIALGGAK
jgi:hypothetical protein